uniref:Uncharacterized protein n=1 Tax=Alexandrium catenella TaxID=2925 RepID=A0A7S1PL89_ALECA
MSSKALAARATKVTTELLFSITNYYCGSHKTLKINVYNSQLERNRADMASMSGDLDSSWWEFFDWGSAGVVRNLMNDHLGMLKDLDRRLAVMQICVLREGFEQSHVEVMRDLKEPLLKVVHDINDCLLSSTLSAADGKFSRDELDKLAKQKLSIEDSVKDLARIWRSVRGDSRNALSPGMRAEGFFFLELSTVGRIVTEFADEIIDDNCRPKPKAIGWKAFTNIFSMEKLKTPDFRNFVVRNWISLMFAWWWAVIANNFATSVPTNVVFMLTELPGNSLLMNLEKLEASVFGSLAGTILYRAFHHCTTITRVMKLSSLFIFELIAMFIANYTKEFANVGLLLAVYGGGKLMSVCDDRTSNGEVQTMNSAEFRSLRFFAYAMCIVSLVDSFMKRKPACDQAREKLLEAMDISFDYFKKYISNDTVIGRAEIWQETAEVTERVEAKLTQAESLLGPADQEPRFAKGPFKAGLFHELVAKLRQITLNAQALIRRSQGAPDEGLLVEMVKCESFEAMKAELLEAIDNTGKIVRKVISYDGFGAMSPAMFDGLLKMPVGEHVDEIRKFQEEVKKLKLKTTEESEKNLEYGKTTRFAVVLELLEVYAKELASMMTAAVRHM